jgi:hypothetical protein
MLQRVGCSTGPFCRSGRAAPKNVAGRPLLSGNGWTASASHEGGEVVVVEEEEEEEEEEDA